MNAAFPTSVDQVGNALIQKVVIHVSVCRDSNRQLDKYVKVMITFYSYHRAKKENSFLDHDLNLRASCQSKCMATSHVVYKLPVKVYGNL